MDKLERDKARAARQAEIEAMTASMMGTAAVVTKHPQIYGQRQTTGFDVDNNDGVVDSEEDLEEEVENEDELDNERNGDMSFSFSTSKKGDYIAKDRSLEYDDSKFESQRILPQSVSSKTSNETASLEVFALENKIPVSHHVDLMGHSKAVTCISSEPAGNRVVTGSLDYHMKIFDFGGMDQRHRAFRSQEVDENHPVMSVAHSPSGDKIIVATGSCMPKIFDRDGKELQKFVRGDMYLRDLSNTKGHTMEVTAVAWHPKERNIVMTAGLDGTLRLWDLTGELAFGNLVNKHVLKIQSKNGQARIGATCCCFSHDGNKMFGGAADGSVHIWNVRKQYARPDIVIRPNCYNVNTKVRGVQEIADSIKGFGVTGVTVSSDGKYLASRNEDGAVRVWDLRRSQAQIDKPVVELAGLMNIYSSANVAFSPDNSWIVCTTSLDKTAPDQKSTLCFFQLPFIPSPLIGSPMSLPLAPSKKMVIGVSGVAVDGVTPETSAIFVKWLSNTNQILCSTSSGSTKVFFDPRFSTKGAMLTASRAPPRQKDPNDEVIGEIYNPHALPMFRNDDNMHGPKRGRAYVKHLEQMKATVPQAPAKKGPGTRDNASFFFTQHVMESRALDPSRGDDPRQALLKMDELTKRDPMFYGGAYEKTQPGNQLHTMTFEQEKEEFTKRQKRSLDI